MTQAAESADKADRGSPSYMWVRASMPALQGTEPPYVGSASATHTRDPSLVDGEVMVAEADWQPYPVT